MQGHKIERQFVIRIQQHATDQRSDVWRAARKRAGKKTLAVVIVGKQIVPDHRRPPEETSHTAEMLSIDPGRNDFRSGPKHINRGIKPPPQLCQIARASQLRMRHPPAVRGWADEQPATVDTLGQPRLDLIDHMGLCFSQRGKLTGILRGEHPGDVVKEHGKVAATETRHLLQASDQQPKVVGRVVADVEAWMNRKHQVNLLLTAGGDPVAECCGLCCRQRLPPDRTVVRIVLGSVEVGLQSTLRHPCKEL